MKNLIIPKSWLIDKLSDDFVLQNVVISVTSAIEDDDKFYSKTFLEEVLVPCISAYPNLIRKSKKNFHLRSAYDSKFHKLHISLPKHIVATACGLSKENFSFPGPTQENFKPTFLHSKSSFPWFTSETKKWNHGLTMRRLSYHRAINKFFNPSHSHPPTGN